MSKVRYWIVWNDSGFRRGREGVITHAMAETEDGRSRVLCGARTNDGGEAEIPENSEPGCIRCRDALRKLGVIAPRQ